MVNGVMIQKLVNILFFKRKEILKRWLKMKGAKKVHFPVLVERDENGFLWLNVLFFKGATYRAKRWTRR